MQGIVDQAGVKSCHRLEGHEAHVAFHIMYSRPITVVEIQQLHS